MREIRFRRIGEIIKQLCLGHTLAHGSIALKFGDEPDVQPIIDGLGRISNSRVL